MDLPAGRILEYKYVLVDSSTRQALSWQQGNNSVLALRQDDREVCACLPRDMVPEVFPILLLDLCMQPLSCQLAFPACYPQAAPPTTWTIDSCVRKVQALQLVKQ